MSWGEAIRLTRELSADPASHVGAALAGWAFPLSREAMALMDLFDAYASATFKKPKPYPRPWDARKGKRFGNAALPIADLRRVLDTHRAAVDAEQAHERAEVRRG